MLEEPLLWWVCRHPGSLAHMDHTYLQSGDSCWLVVYIYPLMEVCRVLEEVYMVLWKVVCRALGLWVCRVSQSEVCRLHSEVVCSGQVLGCICGVASDISWLVVESILVWWWVVHSS